MNNEIKKIKVKVTLLEDMLGTVPKNKDIFKDHIQSKAVEKELLTQEKVDEELKSVGDLEEKGWTGFMSDDNGLFIFDYLMKGFIKEAGNTLKDRLGVKALRDKLDKYVFIFPRKIYLGKKEPDGIIERSLRVMTMQGPRTCLARSDKIAAGTSFEIEIHILPHKEVSEELVMECLGYGKYKGLGQFRNGSYGRFSFEVAK